MPVPLADKEKTWLLIIPIRTKTKMFAYESLAVVRESLWEREFCGGGGRAVGRIGEGMRVYKRNRGGERGVGRFVEKGRRRRAKGQGQVIKSFNLAIT